MIANPSLPDPLQGNGVVLIDEHLNVDSQRYNIKIILNNIILILTKNYMILEAAILNVKPGLESNFENNFQKASQIISSINGYLSHELHKCIEVEGKYLLLVRWETLESHTVEFRGSAEYQEWKKLLHHFYDPFPTVEHFQKIDI